MIRPISVCYFYNKYPRLANLQELKICLPIVLKAGAFILFVCLFWFGILRQFLSSYEAFPIDKVGLEFTEIYFLLSSKFWD